MDLDLDLLQMDLGTEQELDTSDSEDISDTFNKMSINDIVFLDRETIVYNAMAEDAPEDRRVIVKLMLDNVWYDALVDTGATRSFIDRAVVKEHGILSTKTHGQIYLGHNKQLVERTGQTEPVSIWCNEHSIFVPLEILDLRFPFVIGMDIFYRLGFGISGMADGHENAVTLPPPIPDQRPSLTPLTTPPEELTQEFQEQRNQFLTAIEDALDENARIPLTSYCPVPEMRVFLPVPKGTRLYRRPRSFAEQQMQIFDEQVAKWLDEEVITEASVGNPHNNTLTLAAKKDNLGNKTKWRVCLDPRPLNKLLPDDNHPVPLIMDILRRIGGHKVFTTIDLRQAYHRLPVNPADRELTAFMHNGIQYMFKRAPFGLKPLSSIFQRGMTRILGDLPFVCVFIDDIVIFSKSKEEHAEHVKAVIERLNEAKLIINREKCRFFVTQVVLLGYVVDAQGRRVDPSKLANIDDWQPPTTAKQVQSYLGTFNFFREHIPLYSTLAAPLDKLRTRTAPFTLNEEELNAFNTFKQLLVQAPVLHFPDFGNEFHIATDASNVGIGAVLYQKYKNEETNKWENRYISFMARSLQPSERRYSATKKELLAIVFALKKFHYYVWGRHFSLYTDHKALTYIHSQKDLSPMMTGWQDVLMDYDFSVYHCPGVRNILPDHLSRLFPQETTTSQDDIHAQYMQEFQDMDNSYVTVSDEETRKKIMEDVHNLGHPGMKSMVSQIHEQRWNWPNIGQDCLQHVMKCRECQRYNIARKGYHPMQAIHAHLPGEHMAVDLCGPFPPTKKGKRYAMVLVDVCTRFVFLRAIKNKMGATVGKALFKIFCIIGFPKVLQTDNGKEFVNHLMSNLTDEFGTEHRLTTPYHPRGNGVAERNVQTALQKVRKELRGNYETWAGHLPMVQLAMNTSVVALHNSSPYSLFFARKFNGFHKGTDHNNKPLSRKELINRLEYMTTVVFPAVDEKARETQKRMIDRFNATVLHNTFPDGAKVMTLDPIKGEKSTPVYEGPYTVVRRTSGGSYELRDGTGAPLTRNYAPSQMKLVLEEPSDEPTYVVDKIIGHEKDPNDPNRWIYETQWKGYGKKDNTWEPNANFIEQSCIRDYWREQNAKTEEKTDEAIENIQGRKRKATPVKRTGKKAKTEKTARTLRPRK